MLIGDIALRTGQKKINPEVYIESPKNSGNWKDGPAHSSPDHILWDTLGIKCLFDEKTHKERESLLEIHTLIFVYKFTRQNKLTYFSNRINE